MERNSLNTTQEDLLKEGSCAWRPTYTIQVETQSGSHLGTGHVRRTEVASVLLPG